MRSCKVCGSFGNVLWVFVVLKGLREKRLVCVWGGAVFFGRKRCA